MKVTYKIRPRKEIFLVLGVSRENEEIWLKDALTEKAAQEFIDGLKTDFDSEKELYRYWDSLQTTFVLGIM